MRLFPSALSKTRMARSSKPRTSMAAPSTASPAPWRRRWLLLPALAVLIGLALLAMPAQRRHGTAAPGPIDTSAAPAARYVGAAACAACHQAETAAWQGSHHAVAMQPAGERTVLGRFDQTRFDDKDISATFFRKQGGYFVRTGDADGKPADFQIRYTFGVYPLQQYLVPFADGRMQTLPIAWDARPAARGGQRWFNLQAGQHVDRRDALHWTRLDQNWNFMCAGCHSTNLRRNYDAANDRYATTWTDTGVGCESCHGPGSNHLAWAAQAPGSGRSGTDKGLAIALDERGGVQWLHDAGNGQPRRSAPLASHREIETCAVCHARGRGITDDPGPAGKLFDTHDPALLDAGLYFPDGQQQGEVYVYGSFLQSRMYAQGVSCSDCHEPHTLKLRAAGNALCGQCHAPARYDSTAHHLHAPGSAGAQCVACHMPARTYMQVDPRRDHSLRVPRPDLTLQYGVPNACNGCHADKSAAWAAAAIEQAHGAQRQGYQHFAGALAGARSGAPGTLQQLLALAGDTTSPDIARATAVAALGVYPGESTLPGLRDAAANTDPLLRSAAMDALLSFPPQQRAALALPLAADDSLDVRVKAGRALATVPDPLLSVEQRALRERLFAAYVSSELSQAERPEAHFNLGSVYAERGATAQAQQEFRAALRLDPGFVPAYANFSDLYRSLGREDKAGAILDQGLRAVPDDATLLHLSGLQHIRAGDRTAALELLRKAALHAPDNARFTYVYAVALHSAGQPGAAIAVLEQALQRLPDAPDLLSGAATFEREAGHADQAGVYARRYAAVTADRAADR